VRTFVYIGLCILDRRTSCHAAGIYGLPFLYRPLQEQTPEPISTGASVGRPIPYTIDVRDNNSWLRFSYQRIVRRAPRRGQNTLRIRVEASRGSLHASWSRSALPTHRRNYPGRKRPHALLSTSCGSPTSEPRRVCSERSRGGHKILR
jgi:hypothetical protein